MGIQNSINSAIGSVGQMVAIGKAAKAYSEDKATKAKEQAIKEAEKKENIVNKGMALQQEGLDIATEEQNLANQLSKAKGDLAAAQRAVTFKANPENQQAVATAKATVTELKEMKRVRTDEFKARREALAKKIEAHNEVAGLYGVKGIPTEGGKK